MLAGQGWQEITAAPPWQQWVISEPSAILTRGLSAAEMVEVIVPIAVLIWLATAQRLWRAWPLLLTAMLATATLSTLLWHLLRIAAHHLG